MKIPFLLLALTCLLVGCEANPDAASDSQPTAAQLAGPSPLSTGSGAPYGGPAGIGSSASGNPSLGLGGIPTANGVR